MKTVLIIGADFAPSSLPPATRIRFLASHISEFGWQPIVLTTKPEYYATAVDLENEQLLPHSLQVIRTSALPVSVTSKIGIRDVGMRSLWHHWRALSRLQRETKIDLVFIPVPPAVTMILGRLAHLRFGIPYVIDYIDPWITDYYWTIPREQRPPKWALSYALSRCVEPIAIKRARHLTGVSKETTDGVLARYQWLSNLDTSEIPYGAEANDFAYIRRNPRQNKFFDSQDGYTHISYVGAYVGTMEGSLRAIFAAFRDGLKRSQSVFDKILLHFVGTNYATNGADPFRVTRIAKECKVESWVREHPHRVPYLDSLQIILDSQALIILGSAEPHYTASKVFPSILAQRPILAVLHEDSTAGRILRDVNAARVVSFNSQNGPQVHVEAISKNLEDVVLRPCTMQTRWDAFESYTTRAMAARLAQVFELALGSEIKSER